MVLRILSYLLCRLPVSKKNGTASLTETIKHIHIRTASFLSTPSQNALSTAVTAFQCLRYPTVKFQSKWSEVCGK